MKSMCKNGLLVLTATLVMGALTASSALASTEWVTKTGGIAGQLKSPVTVKGTTNISVTNTKWLGEKVSCEGTVEATLEAGGVGKITSYAVSKCTGTSNCTVLGSVSAVNLPWKIELYSPESGAIRQRILSGGSGTPGWSFECRSLEVEKNLCNFNTSTNMINQSSSGDVEAKFDLKSNRTWCTGGGEESGLIEGTIVFDHPAGVEALKVAEVKPSEWLQAGKALSSAVNTSWKGSLKLTDIQVGLTVECSDTGEGTAERGTGGSETKWAITGCTQIKGSCENTPTVEAVYLPWSTTLNAAIGGTVNQSIFNGAGDAGYEITCRIIKLNVHDYCTGTLDAGLKNVAEGVSETLGDEKLACSNGHEGGTVEGTQTIQATSGGKLEVS